MNLVRRSSCLVAMIVTHFATVCGSSAQTIITDSGLGTLGEVIVARDAFRSALGGGSVPGANGSFGGVRYEINWDGVPNVFAAPNNFSPAFFNTNSPRGVTFSTPGTGFQVSATTGSGVPVEFGNIDAALPGMFTTFSSERLFTPLGSNVFDISFYLPGTATAAVTTGFGAVFTDVDLLNTTSIAYYDATDKVIGTWYAPAHSGNETLSFLGVAFDAPIVARVRITLGNAIVGSLAAGADYVVVDDLFYGAPVPPQAVTPVPEPSTYALGSVLVAAAAIAWRRRRTSQTR